MTSNPMIIFNTGWMKNYEGYDDKDPLINGGKEPQKEGKGGEVWNFKVENGLCYGYVMTNTFAGVDLNKVSETKKWSPKDKLKGVDIIFTATPEQGGKHVVGWYRNATLYHKHYKSRSGFSDKTNDRIHYLTKTLSVNAKLLPVEQRTFDISSGTEDFPGTNPVFYLHTKERRQLKLKISKYIESFTEGGGSSAGDLLEDIDEINNDAKLTETERKSLTAARLGQGAFRKALDNRWKDKCAVTKIKTRHLLRASHIKPWKSSNNDERLDPNNGLLLSANIDALFDKGLITFLGTGEMKLSTALEKSTASKIGLPKKIKRKLKTTEKEFLQYHRDNIFIK